MNSAPVNIAASARYEKMAKRATEQKTFRLWCQHTAPGNELRATNRTFQAATKAAAERKADRFVESAQLSAMLYEVREDG